MTELNLKRSQIIIFWIFQDTKIICQMKGKKEKIEMKGMFFYLKIYVFTPYLNIIIVIIHNNIPLI